jgi:MoxR-like ATPase
MTTLTPSELLDFLLDVAPVLPVFIKGPPGGAKTSMVELFCESVGLECVILHGSTCLPEDVIGLPIPNHEERKTFYYPPARLARAKPYCLFLDEFPNASKEVQKSFYSLVQHRRTDSFRIPEGSIVILGGNRAQDQALVNPVSSALVNRVCVVEMADSHREFLDFGSRNLFHPWVTEFIAARPDHLRSAPGQSGDPPFPHPAPGTSCPTG